MITSSVDGFGAFKPLKALKKVGKATVSVAKKTALAPLTISKAAFALAIKPIKAPINTIKNRRAKKISWDRRKSLSPNKTEIAEARSWTKKEFKKKGPHGFMLAQLASPPSMLGDAYSHGFGVAPAAIAAAAPVLTALAKKIAEDLLKKGLAPANPQDAQAAAAPPATVPTETQAEIVEAQAEEQLEPVEEQEAEETLSGNFGATGAPSTQAWLGLALGIAAVATGTYLARR